MSRNMPFKIYTENKYMWALSLAIVSINISIAIGDGTELGLVQLYWERLLWRGFNVVKKCKWQTWVGDELG